MTSSRILFAALVLCGFLARTAAAGPVTLTQGGWTFGGPLTVTFTGQDGNFDGAIDQSELSAFLAAYVLPLGGSTVWSITDLQPNGFLFSSVDDYLFFATNADYSLIDSAFQGQVTSSVVDSFLFPIDLTDAVPAVAPEPGGLAGIGMLALVVAGYVRRREKVGMLEADQKKAT